MLPPALLPPFSASFRGRLLAAFSTFRFCASGAASGSGSLVFCVNRVILVPVFCFWSCFRKRFPRPPRYPRSDFLLPVVLLEAFSVFSAGFPNTECYCCSACSPSLRVYHTERRRERRPKNGSFVDKGIHCYCILFFDTP